MKLFESQEIHLVYLQHIETETETDIDTEILFSDKTVKKSEKLTT